MADVNFPPAADLATMMNLPFPMYKEMQNRIGLANQFAQQNLQQGQEDIRAKTLANQFAQDANPLKVQGLQIGNDTAQSEGRIKKVDADQREATKDEELLAKRTAYLAKATDDQLKLLETQAQKDMLSEDPAIQQRGLKKLMASKSEWDRRNAVQDKKDIQREELTSREKIAAGNNAATLGAAQIGANARTTAAQARAKGAMDFDAAVQAGKITPAKAATYYAMKAQQATDPEEQAFNFSRAAQFEKLAQSTNGAPKTGVDVPAVAGMPAMQAPSAFGPRPQPSAPAGGQKPALPPGWKSVN